MAAHKICCGKNMIQSKDIGILTTLQIRNTVMLDLKAFTYSTPQQPFLQRALIQTIEKLTGQIKIWNLYREYTVEDPALHENFWDAAVKKLNLNVNYDTDSLNKIPKTGSLVVVANHPYGVLDGLIITQLMKRVRPDFKVLTNSVLCRAPEAGDDLLPIDFSETEEALVINLSTRKKARDILKNGGCIVVFPAGGISTIPTWKDHVAQDTTWQPFIGKLIQESRADVIPVFFEGQNSRLFQLVSLFSSTLRLALIFKEVADKIGERIGVRIGTLIHYTDLSHCPDRNTLCQELRERTYALGGMTTLPPAKPAYRTNAKKS